MLECRRFRSGVTSYPHPLSEILRLTNSNRPLPASQAPVLWNEDTNMPLPSSKPPLRMAINVNYLHFYQIIPVHKTQMDNG